MPFPTSGHRFLHTNLITESNATPSDVATGRVSQGTKDVSNGGAAGRFGGVYTGTTEKQIVIEIDSTILGTAIGEATYKVSYDNGATWAASGQATAASVTLPSGSGLTFLWSAAVSGFDFQQGDRWKGKVILPHAVAAGIDFQDLNRTFRFKDAVGTKTVLIDHGSATPADAFFCHSHNFTSGATIRLQRHATDSWGAPTVNELLTWAALKMGKFFSSTSLRYSRISVLDASNTQAPEFKPFLGAYLELATRKLSHVPWEQHAEWFGAKAEGPYGYARARVETRAERFPLNYGFLSVAEYDALVTMRNAVWNTTSGVYSPLIFVPDFSLPAGAYACRIESFGLRGSGPVGYAGQLLLTEVVRGRA